MSVILWPEKHRKPAHENGEKMRTCYEMVPPAGIKVRHTYGVPCSLYPLFVPNFSYSETKQKLNRRDHF